MAPLHCADSMNIISGFLNGGLGRSLEFPKPWAMFAVCVHQMSV